MHKKPQTDFFVSVDTKILSKAISTKLKTAWPTLIFSKETSYVKNRFIGESGTFIPLSPINIFFT